MWSRRLYQLWAAVGLAACLFPQVGARPLAAGREDDRPYGLDRRVEWNSSRIRGTPDPPDPYRARKAFPHLRFAEPLALMYMPGTDRLLVVERYGKIYSFHNDPETKEADLLLDLGKVAYGAAVHPRFVENGFVYVTYVQDAARKLPKGTRVSRFKATGKNRLRCDPGSEKVILEWPSGGHNGGCLKFGPDGYLYVATGDASDIADGRLTGQDISDLPGSILRIDVDKPDPGKAYGVPDDNPYVDVAGARPEIWAYGLRQAWKMSFDRATGELWAGNVGQDLWEMVFRIERGGNYGWSVMEGSHPFRPERRRGPTPILPPLIEHDHTNARSITGGFVYRGSRLRRLVGTYVYGDYDTGRVWGLRYEGGKVTSHEELADTSLRLVGFAEDAAGDLYLLDHMGGGIHRLDPATRAQETPAFPRRLSQTGLFASAASQTPAPGVIPYSVVAAVWCDGAHKERFLALPGRSQIEFEAMQFPQPAPGAPFGWKFPDGAVLVETISLELEKGHPASRRRLETRILHHERLQGTEEVGDQLWRGYTYVWNDEQDDAILLEKPQGLDRKFTVRDPEAPGGRRRQTWHFPSRAECTVCHNMAAKYVLGVNTLQMNKEHDYGRVVDNQLRTLEHLGIFTAPLPARPEELPRLVSPLDGSASLDRRARSYLHANCSHCHRKWGGGNADFQLLYPLGLPETGTSGVRPAHGDFGLTETRIVAPADPFRSVLLYRMAKLGRGRMPRLGSSVVDESGVRLIQRWIATLPPSTEDRNPAAETARARTVATLHALRDGASDDHVLRDRRIDELLASTGGALLLARATADGSTTGPLRRAVVARGTNHLDVQVRDLFERFVPEEQRARRLGSDVDPAEILARPGDVDRGKRIFFEAAGVQCKSCHRIDGQGADVGPDLSEIGKKYDRARMLTTILEPSKDIEPKFVAYLATTRAGNVHSGLLVKKTREEIVLKDSRGQQIRLAAADVELLLPQRQSLMPELLLSDMTAQEVADLVEYLATRK